MYTVLALCVLPSNKNIFVLLFSADTDDTHLIFDVHSGSGPGSHLPIQHLLPIYKFALIFQIYGQM